MNTEPKIEQWGLCKVAWIDSSNIEATLSLVEAGEVNGIGISRLYFKSTDISFLKDIKNLQGLILPFAKEIDVEQLKKMPHLRFLTLGENTQRIDFRDFPSLEELRIDWHSKVILPRDDNKLTSLYIHGYKPSSKSLIDFPKMLNLIDIEIIQGNLLSLDGIEDFPKLKKASFSYLKKLEMVKALNQTSINELEIDCCKKVSDVTEINCKELKKFLFTNCGTLKSIQFLHNFNKLENFRFVNTLIEDGDMSPLFKIKSVGFFKKKHYSHSPEEINKIIEKVWNVKHHSLDKIKNGKSSKTPKGSQCS